ncbi:rhomboid family intramembrane serine protease, partial [candidate division KSB1 bacterium]|nr:rhomboid family intramembrane serine protease [candidate division KSB1 bacterium]
ILTGVCIVLYILALLMDMSALAQPRGLFGLLAPSREALQRLGMTGSDGMSQGYWWTLITAIYLHGSLLHIFFNLLWLRNLGYMVEELFGTSRAFIIFTLSGVIGYVVSNLLGVLFTVGASGSIFGLLGALIYYGRKRGGTFGTAVYRQVGIWAIMAFVFGFMLPGVNNFAHAGGFAGGYLTAMMLGFHEFKREQHWHRLLAMALIVITVLCFVLVLTMRM